VLSIQVRRFSIDFDIYLRLFLKVLTVYLLHKKRVGLKEFLLSNSNITTSGYLRLLIIAIIGSACLVPLGLWLLIRGLFSVSSWPGWDSTHADMSYVAIVPANFWRSDRILHSNLEITRWEFVFSAVVFFACFGLHEEARASYRSAVRRLIMRLLCIRNIKYFFPSIFICSNELMLLIV
jgi:pheromone a factor receptor